LFLDRINRIDWIKERILSILLAAGKPVDPVYSSCCC